MNARLTLAAALVLAGFAAIAALLLPNPPARAASPAPAVEAAHEAHAGGTGVSAALDSSADAAFVADLFDGAATEVAPQQLADLVAIGHRICDLDQGDAQWLASLTSGGYTPDEARKIVDTATAAYCPAPSVT